MDSLTHWSGYAAGDIVTRNALLTEHLSLVHHVARQLARSLSADTDIDELVSAGTLGLMSALEAFDVSRGLAFSTFAVPRIRGSILDELRRQDHVPRSIRRKTREISQARELLMRALGRAPEDREVAAQLGVDMETLWRWQSDVEGVFHVPLDRPTGEGDTGMPSPVELLSGEQDEAIDDQLNRKQEVGLLREAILTLSGQERTVISLYYFEELKLHEIADILGLTESRVSQIRSKALIGLRSTLSPIRATPVATVPRATRARRVTQRG
ncbi:MAG: FliA/WhiG family RNA polymerase sigma factor [Gemmatimonadaceae bacterium]|nr:FliA/WhiG family RNA polymerase sigma factor [Gemmatimonadaceae bacterium]